MSPTNKIPYRSPDLYKYVTDIVLDIIPRDSDLELKTGDSKPLGSGLESPKLFDLVLEQNGNNYRCFYLETTEAIYFRFAERCGMFFFSDLEASFL